MNQISNIKFRFKGESLCLRVQRISEDTVIGRVANHPANPGLLLNQVIGVPVKDVLDVCGSLLIHCRDLNIRIGIIIIINILEDLLFVHYQL